MDIKLNIIEQGKYELLEQFTYYSERYDNSITVKPGIYDGATGATDIASAGWLVHDQICNKPYFDNHKPINAWMAATILSDILKEEGRWFRARTWRYTTFLLGCKKSRRNGWW